MDESIDLEKILEEHKKWLGSEHKEGKRANFIGADLRSVEWTDKDLREANFDKADLEGVEFIQVDFRKARFYEANLQKSKIIKSNFSDAILIKSDLRESIIQLSDFVGAKITSSDLRKSDFGVSDFKNADLTSSDLRGSKFLKSNFKDSKLVDVDLRCGNLCSANFEGANVSNIKYDGKGSYRGIRVATCYGSPAFKQFAQDQDYLEEFKEDHKHVHFIWWLFADCGQSFGRWAFWSLIFAVAFGFMFYALGEHAFKVSEIGWSLETMIYYSVVTFTTLGFGDITPMTHVASRWVMAEVILGYVMLGGLISIFANKIARRS